MDTGALKKFAQAARRQLLEQVAARMEQVLQTDSVELREKEEAAKELQEQIKKTSKEAVIDQVAYTWFNRFCALRYMDVNHYSRIGIVSPVEGFTQPEILQEAKQGVIDDSFKVDKQKVVGLLNGQLPSSNPQQEAYRLLLVGACNAYHDQMPFLFPKIDDYTELLMPDDLLSENSVLQEVRETLTAEACEDVEVIGWLYQFYISERKDEVFASKKKIAAEDIPAVTQLFTPHWIVRYLVENSLGRLWMLNHPDSKLTNQMDYYIKPDEPECDYLEINSPEEIKVCDPACGSGHMLTYAFDLLYRIYEEEGYDPVRIPSLILQHNLFGIEIDQRAGHLAAFALMMKAQEKDRRFFSRGVGPNICVLQNISFEQDELDAYKNTVGKDLFTQELCFLLQQFEQAGNFGSLIRPQMQNPPQILACLEELGVFEDMFLRITSDKVKQALKFAEYLSPHYHVVVANPPYMGSRSMNDEIKKFAKDIFPDSKSDLFAMFIERNIELVKPCGFVGMITMQSWMFLSSFKNMRNKLLRNNWITSMAHLGARAFDSIGGEVVSTTSFVIEKVTAPSKKGCYLRLVDGNNENEKDAILKTNIYPDKNTVSENIYYSSSQDFNKIPGTPIAYWVSEKLRDIFSKSDPLSKYVIPRQGFATGKNDVFLRYWHEVEIKKIGFGFTTRSKAKKSGIKWFPCNKGGTFRKWYGNNSYVANWFNDGMEMKNFSGSVIRNPDYYFSEGITWSTISNKLSMRYSPTGHIFETKGSVCFSDNRDLLIYALGFANTKIVDKLLAATSPTLDFHEGPVGRLPFVITDSLYVNDIVNKLIVYLKTDWDSFEESWGFTKHPLLTLSMNSEKINDEYLVLRKHNQVIIDDTRKSEEENNQVFIEAYGLKEEITSEVPLNEITLSCNPYYRYGSKKSEEELEALLLVDTMKEFISYAVGCMLGRYSLDKDGLILANAGETLEDYLGQVPEPIFMPDEDNVIPVLEGEWFEDDIAERFKDFLKITFGEENFEENLGFIEEAIGRDIRSYFVKDFYNHHVKMYKKRPIYWLFSSPKGSFNALVYMHRYRPDTLSVILNDYLVQYREKLTAHKALLETRSISVSASQGEKTKALKEIDQINKVLSELKEYEDEILYPLATQQIEIDLDDGVKVNYKKFSKALKKVAGLSE